MQTTTRTTLDAIEILAKAARHGDEPSRRALMLQVANLLRDTVRDADETDPGAQ